MKFHSWVGIWVGQVALKSRDRQEVQYRDKDEGLNFKMGLGVSSETVNGFSNRNYDLILRYNYCSLAYNNN